MLAAYLVAKDFAGAWWKAALGAALVFPLAFLLGQCSSTQVAKDRVETRQVKAELQATKTDTASKEVAAGERLTATGRITANAEEQTNAISKEPDGTPSAVRRARFCVQLRQQRTPLADIPLYCRSE